MVLLPGMALRRAGCAPSGRCAETSRIRRSITLSAGSPVARITPCARPARRVPFWTG